MVTLAYMMIVIRGKDRPAKEAESVLTRGDSSSAGQWVINCGGSKRQERSRGMMRKMGVLAQMEGVELPRYAHAGHAERTGRRDNGVGGRLNPN